MEKEKSALIEELKIKSLQAEQAANQRYEQYDQHIQLHKNDLQAAKGNLHSKLLPESLLIMCPKKNQESVCFVG